MAAQVTMVDNLKTENDVLECQSYATSHHSRSYQAKSVNNRFGRTHKSQGGGPSSLLQSMLSVKSGHSGAGPCIMDTDDQNAVETYFEQI